MTVVVNNTPSLFSIKNRVFSKKIFHAINMLALCFLVTLAITQCCWADDLLKPGNAAVQDTFGKDSSIMTWLLIGEVVTGIVMYVSTKNIKVLFGVIILSVFINVAYSIIG